MISVSPIERGNTYNGRYLILSLTTQSGGNNEEEEEEEEKKKKKRRRRNHTDQCITSPTPTRLLELQR